ncbi:MAG: glycosyltransferase family 2 protein [Lachnospiraceae bacterium]
MNIQYDRLLQEQRKYIDYHLYKKKIRILIFLFSREYRKISSEYKKRKRNDDDSVEFKELYSFTNRIDKEKWSRRFNKFLNRIKDIKYARVNKNAKKAFKRSKPSYSAIVCIVKNEAQYIREWIAYYIINGIDHIYIANNNSEDDLEEKLVEFIQDGKVTLIQYPGSWAQLPLYRISARCLKRKYRWVAYLDADEFAVAKEGRLVDYLHAHEHEKALGINWVVYGTCGHKERPIGLVMENYTKTFADDDHLLNLRIKTIVNPDEIYDFNSPHFCVLRDGSYAHDEDGNEIDTMWMYTSNSGPAFSGEHKKRKIWINHYWTRSEQDLLEKCQRGYASGGFNPKYENIMKQLDYPLVDNYSIERFVRPVKDYLGL